MAGALITRDMQIQLGPDTGGLLIGEGTAYDFISLEGWDDLPPYSLTDADKPAQPGAWPGPMYPQPRTLTLTLAVTGTATGIGAPSAAQYAANLAALRAITAPGADSTAEIPMVVQLAGQQLQAAVRCQQRALPLARGYAAPGADQATLQLVATDPRRYEATVHTASCGLPAASGGLPYPITYPLAWGTVSSGSLTIANGGDTATAPLLTITGPGTTPSITRLDTGELLRFTLTLAAGDTLAVDTGDGSVTLNGGALYGSLDPVSAAVASFLMPPGSTTLALRVVSGAGATLTAVWQSAYL